MAGHEREVDGSLELQRLLKLLGSRHHLLGACEVHGHAALGGRPFDPTSGYCHVAPLE
jgi:hypothetical protein